ncbi:MAG: toll/interleukin-1 receptor domain-containing protein [Gemmatimonadota bacterium]
MAHDVFISYSSTDQTAALAVLHGLEARGIRCWIAPRDIPPGAIWARSIMEGISGCKALVVVFTASANRSEHVLNEVDAAVRKGAVVVPFRIENVFPDGAMEYHLRARHWLDALTPDLEAHVVQLADQLSRILAGPRPDPPTPPPRPMPADLPVRTPPPLRRSPWTRQRMLMVTGLVAVALVAGAWATRTRAVRDHAFTVREVSSGGGNATTLRVTAHGLRFFEGPSSTAEYFQREYAATFAAATTRYIKLELMLSYDAPGRSFQFPFACPVSQEGGAVVATVPLTATIQAAWDTSYHASGWGRTEPGWWTPGRYRVECRYGDELIARDWFTVEPGAPAVPNGAPTATAAGLSSVRARLRPLRLFESGGGIVAQDERLYAHRFAANTTRYVNVEATLAFDQAAQSIPASLVCRFLRGGTDEVGRVTLPYQIVAGETSRWTASGWGRGTPGSWAAGDYLVACDDGTVTLGQARFTVE